MTISTREIKPTRNMNGQSYGRIIRYKSIKISVKKGEAMQVYTLLRRLNKFYETACYKTQFSFIFMHSQEKLNCNSHANKIKPFSCQAIVSTCRRVDCKVQQSLTIIVQHANLMLFDVASVLMKNLFTVLSIVRLLLLCAITLYISHELYLSAKIIFGWESKLNSLKTSRQLGRQQNTNQPTRCRRCALKVRVLSEQ